MIESKAGSKKSKSNNFKKRSLSRLMAIQVFYQYIFFERKKDLEEIKNELMDNYVLLPEDVPSSYKSKIDEALLNNLLLGLSSNEDAILVEVSAFLKQGWSIDKLDPIMSLILEFATLELMFLSDIPPKVTINEYVNIAASFFDTKRVTFVNGILENLAKKFRVDEMIKIPKKNEY